MASKTPVGFIGLGNMGNPMAKNLLKHGYPVIAYDVFPEACKEFQDLGAQVTDSPADVAERADRIITMLPSSPNAKEVYTGANGILKAKKNMPDHLNAEFLCQEKLDYRKWLYLVTKTSTINFESLNMREIDLEWGQIWLLGPNILEPQALRIKLVDLNSVPSSKLRNTPVHQEFSIQCIISFVNGKQGKQKCQCVGAARAGNLTFMVGGVEQEFDAAKELLTCMGSNVVYCGAVGTGQAAKICNNMLLAISMIGTAEAMNLGIRLGLDPKLLAKILNMSSGRCWSSDTYNPVPGVMEGVPSANNYQGGFGTTLMAKDLGLAQISATNTMTPVPLGSQAHQIYRMMCAKGYALKDFSAVFQFLREEETL
ncbi:hypothetical protein AAES_32814 [Amazona aestiva]|uniref:3-hydroxyisobutyrate dehydrogenase, mitochondrial n=1 Tax=Amazona aestiva TaxID=12930 RepID=A0A0Q3PSM1_AMAAE|nr:hypothetical protein AAES_32814 [Amazona aestiva]